MRPRRPLPVNSVKTSARPLSGPGADAEGRALPQDGALGLGDRPGLGRGGPAAVLLSGASAGLRNVARRVGRSWFGTVAVYLVLFLAIRFAANLPLRYFAGFVRQHEYGLSNQTLAKWFGDGIKALGLRRRGWCCSAGCRSG